MTGSTDAPQVFVPYESLVICGNILTNVPIIIKIGDHQPIIIGRGADNHPQIWLSAPLGTSSAWISLVGANTALRPYMLPDKKVLVLQDVKTPETVVMVGNQIVVRAAHDAVNNRANIPLVDFRPIGLNIYGDDHVGLVFGDGIFIGNKFANLAAAFAVQG
jgi:hypothetical protein